MTTSWKLALLILSFGSCVSSATYNYQPFNYRIPKPSILAFRPKGLQVSIPHTDGIQLFAFQANINKELDPLDRGQLAKDVRERDGERWCFEDEKVKLEVGDVVHYRVYVVKDNIGYRFQNGVYQITALEPHDASSLPSFESTPSPCEGGEKPDHNQSICEKVVLNLTQSLLDLQQEIDSLRETNDILRDMLEKHPETSTTLTLDGVKVKDDDLVTIVQAIIQEKLHLPFQVRNVARRKSGLVQFQVAGISEKLEVVRAAKRDLKYSRFRITY